MNESTQRPRLIAAAEATVMLAFLASGLVPGADTYIVLSLGWLSLRVRRVGWKGIGLTRPPHVPRLLVLGATIGVVWALFDIFVVEPTVGRALGQPVNLEQFAGITGNPTHYLLMLLIVWVLVAWAEELTYRGYLLNRCADAIGRSALGWTVTLLVVSTVFGMAHAYQGLSGVITTSYAGFVLGCLYLLSGKNLWLPIVVHGTYDTIGITLIFLGRYPGVSLR